MEQGFDIDGARKSGYSDDEILSHLTQSRKFDIDGALKSGYSKQDIIGHLSGSPAAPVQDTRSVPEIMLNQAGRALGSAWENFSPLQAIHAALPWNAPETAHRMFDATTNAVGRTREALGKKDYKEAGMSALGAIPLIGPPVEQVSRDVSAGNLPEAIGHAGGIAAMGELPKLAAPIARVAGAPIRAGQKIGDLASTPAGQAALIDLIPYYGNKINKIRTLMSPSEIPPPPFEPFNVNPAVASRIKYGGPAPSQADAPAYVSRKSARSYQGGDEPLTLLPPPDFPEPMEFKVNPNIAKKTKFGGPAPSQADAPSYAPVRPSVRPSERIAPEESSVAVPQIDPELRATARNLGYRGKFEDLPGPIQETIRKAVALPTKGPSTIPPPPGFSTESPVNTSGVAPFKGHSAEMTDLIRQFHAQWPRGTSLRDIASDVFGTPKGAVPSYDQALKIHEWMLKNNGKVPKPGDLR